MDVRHYFLGALVFTSACGAETDGGPACVAETDGGPACVAETDCGPAPEPAPCMPDDVTDPRAEICAKRSADDCDGLIGVVDNNDTCRWVSTKSYVEGATECGEPKAGGACIALAYFGDGCEVAAACAGAMEGSVYFRTTATCETEMFLGGFCGATVVGWKSCVWNEPASNMCVLPYPDAGPALCNCNC